MLVTFECISKIQWFGKCDNSLDTHLGKRKNLMFNIVRQMANKKPSKASGGRPYEIGSRNMAATKRMNFLTLVSYSLLQTLFG